MENYLDQFNQLRKGEVAQPTPEQMSHYVADYQALEQQVEQQIATYKQVLSKIRHRTSHLQIQSEIIKLDIQPGQIITYSDYRGTPYQWYYIDEVRGKKKNTLRCRFITEIPIGVDAQPRPEVRLFSIARDTMLSRDATGTHLHISSPLGELVRSGINFVSLLDATTGLQDKKIFAFHCKKGWCDVSDQIVTISGKTKRVVEYQGWDLGRALNQLKIEW